MKKTLLIGAFLFASLVSFSAGAGNDVTTKPEVYFLKSSQVVSSYDLLPPPPAVDSIAFLNDKAQYEKGKLLRNTERGKQAYNDAQVEGDGVPRAFSEAFGYTISAQTTPEIFKLVTKLREDAGDLATRSAKQTYMRIRPFAYFKESTCRPEDEATLSKNGSYPSGHTSIGWATALVLAEINPARQSEIIKRGYEMGQSRVICGYHWQSDVDAAANDWAATAWYSLADGTKRIKRFTYALTRGSLQDGPGANAMWNITNVTRSDRHYLYTTKAWAKAMSENQDVINYIQQNGSDAASLLHPYYADGSRDSISYLVNLLLGLNKPSDKATYEKYFVEPYGEEMTDKDYYDFMVWHRGLSVPGARNLYDPQVKRGKVLFYEMGCTACHRPSWKTGADNYYTDAITRGQGALPRYAHQTIWPYTDMIQHRLYMDNNIRTDWCRTTPLWGRGLSYQETGAHDRLHDCRARNVIEAIMWHGVSEKSEAKWATDKFYKLKKSDRDAVVAFIDAI